MDVGGSPICVVKVRVLSFGMPELPACNMVFCARPSFTELSAPAMLIETGTTRMGGICVCSTASVTPAPGSRPRLMAASLSAPARLLLPGPEAGLFNAGGAGTFSVRASFVASPGDPGAAPVPGKAGAGLNTVAPITATGAASASDCTT